MPQKRFRIFLFVGFPAAVFLWLCLLFVAAGYQYENGKFKAMVFTIALVLIFQFIIADPIKFVVIAFWKTFMQKIPKLEVFHHGIPRSKQEKDDILFFKMRIDWGKSRLGYNWRHRDEALNTFYRNVARDLLFFGRYFISLIILVVILNEPLKYYYSEGLYKVFSVKRSTGSDVEELGNIKSLFDYIFNQRKVFAARKNKESELNWVADEMGKLLGVQRMEQIRLKNRMVGLSAPSFEDRKFLPGWKPYEDYPYREKYWRTYDPWIPVKITDRSFAYKEGFLASYPTGQSYVAHLTRETGKKSKVLEFLEYQKWLDRHTSALFIDFTIYNVDVNLFALSQIRAENTPFGRIILCSNIESSLLLLNWDHTSKWYWLVLLIYAIQLINFIKTLVLKAWYGSIVSLITFWNMLDFFIVILNVLVFVFIYLREEETVHVLNRFEMASKQEYISFQRAVKYEHYADIFLALLLCCATIRLWKVLLFARVFRLFVRTLELGASDIFWALLNIMVFMIGLTLSSYMINGGSRTQSHAPITLVHILSFSLGYSERVNPMENTQMKDSALGLIVYALMMFGVTLVLLNMLITLICIHYTEAKEEERLRSKPKINFWQFLKVEYSHLFQYIYKIFHKMKRKFQRPILNKVHHNKGVIENLFRIPPKKKSKDQSSAIAEKQANRLRRSHIMTDILLTQTEILNRRLQDLSILIDKNNTQK